MAKNEYQHFNPTTHNLDVKIATVKTGSHCKDVEPIKRVMPFKDYSPIHLEMFQTEIEEMMITLNRVKRLLDEFEHKISCHKEREEWK